MSASVFKRARIKPIPIRKDLERGDLLLTVGLICNAVSEEQSLFVYTITVDFSTYADGFLGNVRLGGGQSWSGIYSESEVVFTIREMVGSAIESYVSTNFQ